MMPLFSQVETTLGETLRLFTLLGGVEAVEKRKGVSYKAELLNTVPVTSLLNQPLHQYIHSENSVNQKEEITSYNIQW